MPCANAMAGGGSESCAVKDVSPDLSMCGPNSDSVQISKFNGKDVEKYGCYDSHLWQNDCPYASVSLSTISALYLLT